MSGKRAVTTGSAPLTLPVLRELVIAGAAGELAANIARKFTYPEDQQKRNSRVNQVLSKQLEHGRCLRSAKLEPSSFYHNVPAYRWFITENGVDYWKHGGRDGVADRLRELSAEARSERELIRQYRRAIVANPSSVIGDLDVRCQRQRGEAIQRLLDCHLTLSEAGQVLGITRERVRQVYRDGTPAGHSCYHCVTL